MYLYNSLYRTVRDGELVVMPAPVDADTPDALWETERAIQMVPVLAAYGCGGWVWPPLTMSQGGSAPNADGYGKQYDLNIGQFGNPTRWGETTMLRMAIQTMHRHGMLVLEDAVIHQYDGGNHGNYLELGGDGKPDPLLFPKYPACFAPDVPADTVFDPDGNAAFGDRVSYTHCLPSGYMLGNVTKAMHWRRSRLGLDGMRLDDTKGTAVSVTKHLLDALPGFHFCETFTGDPDELERFVHLTGGAVMDFTLHWALQAVCDGGMSLRSIPGNGFYARDPEHAVLFVDSADTDLNNGENIKFNKLWAYLIITTLPARAALIYAGDYEKYGLAPALHQLMWTGSTFALGALTWQHVQDDVLVWSRDGDGGPLGWSGGLLCAFSRDPMEARSAWVNTPFQPNTHLHDYLGHGPDLWTNADGWVQLELGPNVYGSASNGVAYAPAGVDRAIPITPIREHMTGSLTDFSEFADA